MTLVEIALDDVDGASVAEAAGAGRLELCGGMADGGTTPSIGLARVVASRLTTASLLLLIRPRVGGFVYTTLETDVMVADIRSLRVAVPTAGFVIGALRSDGTIDTDALRRLLDAASGAPVTFHKAFDSTPDLPAALDTLLGLGVDRVLTSGGRATAVEGIPMLRSLVERAAGRIGIVAGGSVRADAAARIVAESGVTEVHLKARRPRETDGQTGQYAASLAETDGDLVREIVVAVCS